MNDAPRHGEASATAAAGNSLWQLVGHMPCLGTRGFGGPVAPVGYMYRGRVEMRRWISEGATRRASPRPG